MEFDAKKTTTEIITFIQDYFTKNHLKGVVLGVSGGKDSAVVAGLFSKALGPENVIGVTLPCNSKSTDALDAKLVADKFGFELINLDLTPVYEAFVNEAAKLDDCAIAAKEELSPANINLKPRLRMSSTYYLAALYSFIKGGPFIVAGTSNKCELYVGYFTKGGDSTHDIAVLADLTVPEVIAVGEVIEVPPTVLYKTPSDGISAQSDEDKMGVKYADITRVINGELTNGPEYEKIQKLHNSCQHKFNIPRYYKNKN